MVEAMQGIPEQNEHPSHRRFYRLAKWLVVTAAYAWVMPFVVLGGIAAVSCLVGISTFFIRRDVVGFAILDSDSWNAVSVYWGHFRATCAVAVILWRIWKSPPVQAAIERVWVRIENTIARLGDRLAPVMEPAEAYFGRLPKTIQVAVFVIAGIALPLGFLSLLLVCNPDDKPMQDRMVERPLLPLPPGAALRLPDGTLKSGQATIVQQPDNSFVVMFK